MRDSDWSRPNFLRSDWLLVIVATITTSDLAVFRIRVVVNAQICHRTTMHGPMHQQIWLVIAINRPTLAFTSRVYKIYSI